MAAGGGFRSTSAGGRPILSAVVAGRTLAWEPSIDGLRAFAVGIVLLLHVGMPGFSGGSYGVDIFFVLSGFLITAKLVEEYDSTGRISLTRFWMRRALRLAPALFAMLVVVVLVLRWLPSQTRGGVVPSLFYWSNWKMALEEVWIGGLAHTWSLAIEEQFYLLWPLAFWALIRGDRTLKLAIALCATLAVLVVLLRAHAMGQLPLARWYYGFDYRADGLLIGCAFAFWWCRRGLPRSLASPAAFTLGVVSMLAILLRSETDTDVGWLEHYERAAVPIATVLMLGALLDHRNDGLRRVLGSRVPGWVGARSYGIYLWHYPMTVLTFVDIDALIIKLAVIAATLAVAGVSYRYVERPALRFKERLRLTAVAVKRRPQLSSTGASATSAR